MWKLFLFSSTLLLSLTQIYSVYNSIDCWNCQGGLQTNCASVVSKPIECTGENAQCYQAIKSFQNNSIRLVERRCYVPPENDTRTYCEAFNNPNGKLDECVACNTSLCNSIALPKLRICDQNFAAVADLYNEYVQNLKE